MKRRSFMGLLGAVGVTGPKGVAKAVAPVGSEVLSLAGMAYPEDGESMPMAHGVHGSTKWAKEALVKFIGMSAESEAQAKRSYYVNSLDPDTHSLRSVSLGAKMRITRERQYAAWKRNRKPYLEGVIAGLWD